MCVLINWLEFLTLGATFVGLFVMIFSAIGFVETEYLNKPGMWAIVMLVGFIGWVYLDHSMWSIIYRCG